LLYEAAMLSNAQKLLPFVLATFAMLATSLVALLSAGCMEPGDLTVLPGISEYKSSGEYVRVSRGAYDSDLGSDIRIDVWVSANAADAYRQISPEVHGSGATLPYGTVIVREVHDKKSGELQKLTLMYKRTSGVAPEVGDWEYAVTDGAGIPLVNDDGSEKSGLMPECRSCHEKRGAVDDFLFGVPRAARAADDATRAGL
jgi:hypothetical protein